ncbi:MAG TPA: HAD hydrolase family protein [Thermodesulfobacteriota bacterium]|nr:HAD hydrolase family protein [Thermodesulfobacteriota bacterium]
MHREPPPARAEVDPSAAPLPPELLARARRIRLVVLDVDGVLTDGGIAVASDGSETKTFHVRDGHAIKLLQHAGIEVALVSGRRSAPVVRRAAELGISLVVQGASDKAASFEAILAARGLEAAEAAGVGDDIVDLPLLRRAGLAVAVADSAPELAPYVHYVTRAPGGRGAVREVAELILKAQGRWGEVLRRFGGESA